MDKQNEVQFIQVDNCSISKTKRTLAPDGNLILEENTTIIGKTLDECHKYYQKVIK
jgi:hypothetical protein